MENIMSSKLFTTRQGTVLLGVIAAAIAAIALIVYLNHYRNSVKAGDTAFKVLVAQKLIQSGTPGDVIRESAGLYKPTDFTKSQVETGAIVSPATLEGQVAITDISPGQQLTAADFGPAGASAANNLKPDQRGVVVSLASPQEVGGNIGGGSHVDVWVTSTAQGPNGATRPIAKLLFQDMYVMSAGGTSGGNVMLRATPRQAGQIIYASTNDSLWLVLRPTIGTLSKRPPVISTVTGR